MTKLSISVPQSAKLISELFDAWIDGLLPEECQTVNVNCSDYSKLIVLKDMTFLEFVRKVGYGHVPQCIIVKLLLELGITIEQIFGEYGGADLELTSEKYHAKNVTMISRFIVDRVDAIAEMNKYLNSTSRTGTSKKKRKAADDTEAASDTKKPAAEKKPSAAVSSTAATVGGGGLKSVKKGKGAKKKKNDMEDAGKKDSSSSLKDGGSTQKKKIASKTSSTKTPQKSQDTKAKATSAGKPIELTPPTMNGESLKKATLKTAASTKEKVSLEAETPNVGEVKAATTSTSIPTFSSVEVRRTSQQQPIPLQKSKRRVITESSDEESEEEETNPTAFSGNKHEREELKDLSHEELKDLSDTDEEKEDEETKPPAEKKPRSTPDGTASTADSALAPPQYYALFGNTEKVAKKAAKKAAKKKED